LEQYRTFAQSRSHFFRHWIALPQTAQILAALEEDESLMAYVLRVLEIVKAI
jgi:hypothetical protein